MTKPVLVAHVTPHVHWDRAWYLPFQQYRYRLIEFVDDLLDLLEDEDANYPSFEFDGQTVVLEDYLEVKPENKSRIQALVKAGKLGIGPWYVLPDEFIVGGEALVRNLQFGNRISEEFGGRTDIGYVPDPFGHIAQLPAILQGVGLDTFLFTRGAGQWVGEAGCVFNWTASDGKTSVLAVKQTPDYPCLMAWGFEERGLDRKDSPNVNIETAMGRLQRLLDGLESTYNWQAPVVQFGNGSDHTHPQPTLPMLIKEANKHFEGQIELRHSTFVKFFDELKEWVSSKQEPLVEYSGELHQGWDRALLSGVFSARLYLKRMNDHIMRLLQDQIEPLAAASWSLGGRVRQSRLQLAWREVLRNHPHDDICGCSVDSTHLDMEVRFRHAQEISAMLLDDLHAELRQQFNLSHDDENAIPLILHNPTPRPWTGTLNIDGVLPDSAAWTGSMGGKIEIAHPVEGFSAQAEVMTTAPLWGLHIHDDRVSNVELPRLRGALNISGLPSGMSVVHLLPGIDFKEPEHNPVNVHPDGDWMENGLIKVILREDGRFDLIDLENGRTWMGLGVVEDDEDAGDSYDHSPGGHPIPVGDGKGPSLEQRPDHIGRRVLHEDEQENNCIINADIEKVNSWSSTLHINMEWRLPKRFNDTIQERSADNDWLAIDHYLTMRSGSRFLEIESSIDNTCNDHRVRLILPSGIESDTVHAGAAFDVIERPWHFPHEPTWNQPEVPTQHFSQFVSVQDEQHGLALLCPGSNEYEARQSKYGSGLDLCLTALRSVGWLSRDGFAWRRNRAGPCFPAPGAQCQGMSWFRWGILPYEGDWSEGDADGMAVHEIAEMLSAQANLIPGMPKPQLDSSFDEVEYIGDSDRRLQPWKLIGAEPKPLFASLKPCDDGKGSALRLWNPTNQDWNGELLSDIWTEVEECNLLEQAIEGARDSQVSIPSGAIRTFRLY